MRGAGIYDHEPPPDLVESIRVHGVLVPLWVAPDNTVIAGHRRLRAAKAIGLKTVPATVCEYFDVLVLESNRYRRKTASEMLREGEALEKLFKPAAKGRQRLSKGRGRKGVPTLAPLKVRDQVAEITGLGRENLRKLKEVQAARPELLEKVDAGEMTISAAHSEVKSANFRAKADALLGHNWHPDRWIKSTAMASKVTLEDYEKVRLELDKDERLESLTERENLSIWMLVDACGQQGPTPHPLAGLFPMINEKDRRWLVDSVQKEGLLNPIWLCDGRVLDGRARLVACLVTKTEPKFRIYDGAEKTCAEMVAFLVAQNRQRITDDQAACVAVEVMELYEADNAASEFAVGLERVRYAATLKADERARAAWFEGNTIIKSQGLLVELCRQMEDGSIEDRPDYCRNPLRFLVDSVRDMKRIESEAGKYAMRNECNLGRALNAHEDKKKPAPAAQPNRLRAAREVADRGA